MHAQLVVFAAIGCVALGGVAFTQELISMQVWAALVIGCLCALLMGPDLDQQGVVWSTGIWYRIPVIGVFLGRAWGLFWSFYAQWVPHRSPVSHSIIGTPIRAAYLVAGLYVVAFVVRSIARELGLDPIGQERVVEMFLEIPREVKLAWLGGLFIGDMTHLLRDGTALRLRNVFR